MPPPSIARQYFEDLLARGGDLFGYLNSLPSADVQEARESEWLEIKSGAGARDDKAVRDTWSKTLSAFGNVSGGVLIWGLDCSRDASGIDRVHSVSLVPNPNLLLERLVQVQHQSTEPPLQGVEVKAVPDPSNASRGFVVAYIPEGRVKPIRAESTRQYLIRAGPNSIIVPHAILRSLFVPGFSPVLTFKFSAKALPAPLGLGSPGMECPVFFGEISNGGESTARDVVVMLPKPLPGVDYPQSGWHKGSSSMAPNVFSTGHLLPGETSVVFHVVDPEPRRPKGGAWHFPAGYSRRFEVWLFADNMPAQSGFAEYDENAVVHGESRAIQFQDRSPP